MTSHSNYALGQDTCGCLYLQHGDVLFLVCPCDRGADEEWSFSEGARRDRHVAGVQLQPVSPELAVRAFREWGYLISDGYAARDVHAALSGIEMRRERRMMDNT